MGDDTQLADRITARELSDGLLPISAGRDRKAFGQRVDYAAADAVKPARGFVGTIPELAACVQRREDDVERRGFGLRVDVEWNAAAVIDDLGKVVLDLDADVLGVARDGLVNRVVEDLPEEVMKASGVRTSDVHPWAFANRSKSLEDLNAAGVVAHVSTRYICS